MGRIPHGIHGGVSGTVGNVVGASWRGIDYIRSKPAKREAASTKGQRSHRAKFAQLSAFLQTMKDLLLLGYKDHAWQMTEQNSAFSHNFKNAVTGEYPNAVILYPLIQVTRGSLPNAVQPVASAGRPGMIDFHWTDNSGIGIARQTDKAILVAYCVKLHQTRYTTGAPRSSETDSLFVPAFSGHEVQTWISFVKPDGREVATSIFTGVVTVR